jgi:hypothetical protein
VVRGATLVEVVAGLALLASLLTALLLARARYSQQWVLANQRLAAVQLADELLAEWWTEPQELPRADQGVLDEQRGWKWRTQVIQNHAADSIGVEVIRLEILQEDPEAIPLATLEIVLPQQMIEEAMP